MAKGTNRNKSNVISSSNTASSSSASVAKSSNSEIIVSSSGGGSESNQTHQHHKVDSNNSSNVTVNNATNTNVNVKRQKNKDTTKSVNKQTSLDCTDSAKPGTGSSSVVQSINVVTSTTSVLSFGAVVDSADKKAKTQLQPTSEQIMIAKIIEGNSSLNDPHCRHKIRQVMDITALAEDEVATALFDVRWDQSRAIELLLEKGKDALGEWEDAGKKKKKKPQTSIGTTLVTTAGQVQQHTSSTKSETSKSDSSAMDEWGDDYSAYNTEDVSISSSSLSRRHNTSDIRGGRGGTSTRGTIGDWKVREHLENDRNSAGNLISSRGVQRRGGESRRGGRGGGTVGGRNFQSHFSSVYRGSGDPGRILLGQSELSSGVNSQVASFSGSIDTWNPRETSQTRTNNALAPGGKDAFDNAGNWGDDFPAAEDWDNEEYTGSLAESKVFEASVSDKAIVAKPKTSSSNAVTTRKPIIIPPNVSSAYTSAGTPGTNHYSHPSSRGNIIDLTTLLQKPATKSSSSLMASSLLQFQQQATDSLKAVVGIGGANSKSNKLDLSNYVMEPSNYSNAKSTSIHSSTASVQSRISRTAPPSKIPSTAVEMPGDTFGKHLDVQFGGLVLQFNNNNANTLDNHISAPAGTVSRPNPQTTSGYDFGNLGVPDTKVQSAKAMTVSSVNSNSNSIKIDQQNLLLSKQMMLSHPITSSTAISGSSKSSASNVVVSSMAADSSFKPHSSTAGVANLYGSNRQGGSVLDAKDISNSMTSTSNVSSSSSIQSSTPGYSSKMHYNGSGYPGYTGVSQYLGTNTYNSLGTTATYGNAVNSNYYANSAAAALGGGGGVYSSSKQHQLGGISESLKFESHLGATLGSGITNTTNAMTAKMSATAASAGKMANMTPHGVAGMMPPQYLAPAGLPAYYGMQQPLYAHHSYGSATGLDDLSILQRGGTGLHTLQSTPGYYDHVSQFAGNPLTTTGQSRTNIASGSALTSENTNTASAFGAAVAGNTSAPSINTNADIKTSTTSPIPSTIQSAAMVAAQHQAAQYNMPPGYAYYYGQMPGLQAAAYAGAAAANSAGIYQNAAVNSQFQKAAYGSGYGSGYDTLMGAHGSGIGSKDSSYSASNYTAPNHQNSSNKNNATGGHYWGNANSLAGNSQHW